jgi:hypothetical protein
MLTVSGGSGAGFTYNWSNGATSKDVGNLAAGNYTVTIRDVSIGCSLSQTFTVTQPASLLSLTATRTNVTGCATPGTITATGSGGTSPYQYRLSNGSFQSAATFSNLPAGDYTVWVSDARGCTTSRLVNITDNGNDAYESNNSKNAAKTIPLGMPVYARIALATDVADWFMFTTPAGGGSYTVSLQHPTVSYVVDVYSSAKNAAALVPVSSSATSQQYILAGNTTYYISITGGLSFSCYTLLVNQTAFTTSISNQNQEMIREAGTLTEKLEAKAYPNPHSGAFTLAVVSTEDGMANVEVFTAGGQKLAAKRAAVRNGSGTLFSFSGMPQGLLFYRVTVGSQQTNGKITGVN